MSLLSSMMECGVSTPSIMSNDSTSHPVLDSPTSFWAVVAAVIQEVS